MPLLLTFNGLASEKHTWYLDLDTGAIVQAPSGSAAPYRKVDNAPHYVAMGMATISGSEDGSDGLLDAVTDALRAILIGLDPLVGDPSSWTLDEMITQLHNIQQADEEALAAYEEAQRPHVVSTNPADEATDIEVFAPVSITFDKAMDPLTMIPENFIVIASVGEGNPNLVDSVVMSSGNTVATLGLTGNMLHGINYVIEITTSARTSLGVPFQTQYAQQHGFNTIAGIDTLPAVDSVSPINAATGVALNVHPTITFNRPMDPATMIEANVTLILEPVEIGTAVPSSISMNEANTVATITPTDPLTPGALYALSVAGSSEGGTTADQDGNVMVTTYMQADGFRTTP